MAAVCAVLALLADQATKLWALDVLGTPGRIIQVIELASPPIGFNLRLGFNYGVSFGLFPMEQPWILSGVMAAIILLMVCWLIRAQNLCEVYALAAVIGGASGNLFDRLRHGAVVDFLDLYYGAWHWPTFNVADIFIVCGVGALMAAPFFSRRAPGAP